MDNNIIAFTRQTQGNGAADTSAGSSDQYGFLAHIPFPVRNFFESCGNRTLSCEVAKMPSPSRVQLKTDISLEASIILSARTLKRVPQGKHPTEHW